MTDETDESHDRAAIGGGQRPSGDCENTVAVGAASWSCWCRSTYEAISVEVEKRAKMTGDLLHDYNLVGMSKEQILRFLGPDNNDYGYFNQENRWVYYLGSERTIIDSEWLLIDFEDSIVHEYAMTID